ncbi:MAG: PIG-L family deacetylase [Ignavibacteria bacterium]
MKKILIILLFVFPAIIFSQNSNFTILCVAAHPDDEDGATLAYYSKIMGYNAYTVFYTRGEGGQNEIGSELYDQLGKIREQECYNAAAIQGSSAYFLGELDFGFSKTAAETFKFWGGKDSVLARIVYMIRQIRPDVVISNHDTVTTKPGRQHGNHQAVGISIFEAFDKAADPNYHPEQLVNGITPWQIKKLFFRNIMGTTQTDVYRINIFENDPATNKTIREISREALSQHKTQGMDKISDTSLYFYGNRTYYLVKSDKMYPVEGSDLFADLTPGDKSGRLNDITSFSTKYTYRTLSREDSLGIIRAVNYNSGARIGLVKTYDNTVENILKAFKIRYDTVSANDLKSNDLEKFSTVILDIRAYLYRPDLIENNRNILNYARNGGNVLCFYNKPGEWNDKEYAPYPIYLTSERVTEEDAYVKINDASSYLLYRPNEIKPEVWQNWIQERNIYLPSDDPEKTSSKYLRILGMNDEEDPVPPTSLLWTGYGKGTYTYCSLALYRQLKIFNEGALKLFMNLIAEQLNIDGSIRK